MNAHAFPDSLDEALKSNDPFAKHLARMYGPGTYKTTAFQPWWKKLNELLEENGLPKYMYGEARDAYEMGQTAETELAEALARQP